MAYDEGLAERVRSVVDEQREISEKKMFGGLAFFVGGKMFCGLVKGELMVRVGAEHHAEALKRPHARPMDFTGRPLKGFVYVGADGLESDRQLESWVNPAVAFVRSELAARSAPKSKRRSKSNAKSQPKRRTKA